MADIHPQATAIVTAGWGGCWSRFHGCLEVGLVLLLWVTYSVPPMIFLDAIKHDHQPDATFPSFCL